VAVDFSPLSTKIFVYCERGSDPAFWAEPVNALSNAAFLVAAFAAFTLWQRQPGVPISTGSLALIILVAVIGVGSFLFHTFANGWAKLADVIPITVFMLAYLGYALRVYFAASWIWVATGVALFAVILGGTERIICGNEVCLNGSAGYVPAVVALVLVGYGLRRRAHQAGHGLLIAGGLLLVSLMFRTIDLVICDTLRLPDGRALGSHFVWHVLNALVLFLLLREAILRSGRKKTISVMVSGAG